MRRRSDVSVQPKSATELVVKVSIVHEQVIIAATIAALSGDEPEIGERILDKIQSDTFSVEEHAALWVALRTMRQRKLTYDAATLQTLAGDRVRMTYLAELTSSRPDIPDNLDYHVECLQWDRQRVQVTKGPLASFLLAVANPLEAHERVQSLARSIADGLSGHTQQYIYDPASIVAEQMAEIRKRLDGHAVYPLGLDGLDYFEADHAG